MIELSFLHTIKTSHRYVKRPVSLGIPMVYLTAQQYYLQKATIDTKVFV